MNNREIKFRLWDDNFKKWLELHGSVSPGVFWEHGQMISVQEYLIPSQFTGLKDKNGKEIYEGDILRYGQENGERLPYVNFESGLFGRRYKDWDPKLLPSLDLRDMDFTVVEIVGNIYENPEFLEKGKDSVVNEADPVNPSAC